MYIPHLPESIRGLRIALNNVTDLSNKYFFVNVTQLEYLSLRGNNIVRVSAGVFDLMPNLTELDLSVNPIGLQHDSHISLKKHLLYILSVVCSNGSLQYFIYAAANCIK
jgi:Leucine-rich repeat (LRR) protein